MSIQASEIASDSRVEVAFDFGDGRLLVKMPTDLVTVHDALLRKIRSKSPKTERLLESRKMTEGFFDQLLIYAEKDASGKIIYYVADGHQRLAVAKQAGDKDVWTLVILRWETAEQAYAESVSKQYARFEMQDRDLFGIIKEGKLGTGELVRMTGKSESTIERMGKVAKYDTLTDMIDDKAISTNQAAKLVGKCDDNQIKINALLATMEEKYEKAKEEAKHWHNKYEVDGWPKKQNLRDLAGVPYYFKGEDWTKIESAIEKVKESDTTLNLNEKQSSTAKAEIEVTEAAAVWKDEIPIYFRGGQKHADMTLKNLEQFHKSLPMIGEKLAAIIERRRQEEIAKAIPIPPSNPTTEIKAPKKPKKQSSEMNVD